MLLRLRWMTLGMVLAMTLGAMVATRLVRARQRFTAANLRRAAAGSAADALAWAAGRLRAAEHTEG